MTAPSLRGSVAASAPDAAASGLLVLVPSLGTTTELWAGTVPHLRRRLPGIRILLVDLPGHGASPPIRGTLTMADLAAGVLRVVDDLGGGAFHAAGDSLGGAVALELAASVPERVLSLTMLASGARIGDAAGWADRAASVRASGTASLVAGSVTRWFTPGYLERHPDGPGSRALEQLLDVDDESYAACCDALGLFDRTPDVRGLAVPALLVAGAHDTVVSTASMRALAAAIPDGEYVELPDAAHLVPLEAPAASAELIASHVTRVRDRVGRGRDLAATGPDLAANGEATRRAVLGDEHVDATISAVTAETADFQDFISRYAWGEIWSRPHLSREERSIATLASLVTGGHEAELRMHVRAALRNSLSPERIAEVIMHTAIYAGLPAANAAMGIMREVFAELAASVDPEL